jgi:hypothetical protein
MTFLKYYRTDCFLTPPAFYRLPSTAHLHAVEKVQCISPCTPAMKRPDLHIPTTDIECKVAYFSPWVRVLHNIGNQYFATWRELSITEEAVSKGLGLEVFLRKIRKCILG